MSNDRLDDVLGIDGTESKPPMAIEKAELLDLDTDFNISRVALRKLIEIGVKSATELARLADSADAPQAHVALAGLIKAVTDTSEKLVILTKKYKESQTAVAPAPPKEELVALPRTVDANEIVVLGTMQDILAQHERSLSGD